MAGEDGVVRREKVEMGEDGVVRREEVEMGIKEVMFEDKAIELEECCNIEEFG